MKYSLVVLSDPFEELYEPNSRFENCLFGPPITRLSTDAIYDQCTFRDTVVVMPPESEKPPMLVDCRFVRSPITTEGCLP